MQATPQNLYGGGTGSFLIGTPGPIGTGPDSLVLHIGEAAYQGDAQFTVSVNGTQIGGTETATLPGGIQDFTFQGNWGSAQNTVLVNFTNGLSDAGGSRNLFVEGMSYDGTNYSGNTAESLRRRHGGLPGRNRNAHRHGFRLPRAEGLRGRVRGRRPVHRQR